MTIFLYLLTGVSIGVVGGLVGIGGGVLLIPALTQFFKVDPRKAAGISLAVLAMPVTLPGAWQYYRQGHLSQQDLTTALCLGLAFAVGAVLGALLQHRLDPAVLRVVFGMLLLYIGMRMMVYGTPESFHAAAGLAAAAVGLVGFLLLRMLGRKHLSRPYVGKEIRRHARSSSGRPDDYYI